MEKDFFRTLFCGRMNWYNVFVGDLTEYINCQNLPLCCCTDFMLGICPKELSIQSAKIFLY